MKKINGKKKSSTDSLLKLISTDKLSKYSSLSLEEFKKQLFEGGNDEIRSACECFNVTLLGSDDFIMEKIIEAFLTEKAVAGASTPSTLTQPKYKPDILDRIQGNL